ncbi:MAG: hypothetical protein VX642_04840 [Bdellovibrionota bacterium]|nr:hypothetical protein [Bdellovibrionota bacterium]
MKSLSLFVLCFIFGSSLFAASPSELCPILEKLSKKPVHSLNPHECYELLNDYRLCQKSPQSELCELSRRANHFCKSQTYNGQEETGISYFCKKQDGKYLVNILKKEMCSLPESILKTADSEVDGSSYSWLEACDTSDKKQFFFPYSVSNYRSSDKPKETQAGFDCSKNITKKDFPGITSSASIDTGQEYLEWMSFKGGSDLVEKDVCLAKASSEGYPVVSYSEFDKIGRTARSGQDKTRSGFCVGKKKDSKDAGKLFCMDIDSVSCRDTANLMEHAKLVYGDELNEPTGLYSTVAGTIVSVSNKISLGALPERYEGAQKVLRSNLKSFGRSRGMNNGLVAQHSEELRKKHWVTRIVGSLTSLIDSFADPQEEGQYDSVNDKVRLAEDPNGEKLQRMPNAFYEEDFENNDVRNLDYLSKLFPKEDIEIADLGNWEYLLDRQSRALGVFLKYAKRQCELAGHGFQKTPTGVESQKPAGAVN